MRFREGARPGIDHPVRLQLLGGVPVPTQNTEKSAVKERAEAAKDDKRQKNKEWARKAQGKDTGDTLSDPLPDESED
jgi:hypothetical protein